MCVEQGLKDLASTLTKRNGLQQWFDRLDKFNRLTADHVSRAGVEGACKYPHKAEGPSSGGGEDSGEGLRGHSTGK